MSDTRMAPGGEVVRAARRGLLLLALSLAVGCVSDDVALVAVAGSEPVDLTITLTSSQTTEQTTTPERLDLEVGESAALAATAVNALGQPVGSASVSWGSTDAAVATVSADGEVMAVGAGSAEVFASSNDVFATLPIQVTSPPEPPIGG